jgi:hypothetical protein
VLNVGYTAQMKRLLVFISIILLLGSNIAMSMDSDCLLIQQFQTNHNLDQNQDNDPLDIDYSDDCCHSASHFVGIYPDSTYKAPLLGSRYIRLHFGIVSSQTYQPATPPPNV